MSITLTTNKNKIETYSNSFGSNRLHEEFSWCITDFKMKDINNMETGNGGGGRR